MTPGRPPGSMKPRWMFWLSVTRSPTCWPYRWPRFSCWAEGGYAVEVDEGGGSVRLVAVDPGFFADGLVEVDSDGLEPGDRVVIP